MKPLSLPMILSPALKVARLTALLGLICGLLYSVVGLFYDLFTVGLNRGTAMAFLAILGMPALLGFFGLVFGALGALVARGVGARLYPLRR